MTQSSAVKTEQNGEVFEDRRAEGSRGRTVPDKRRDERRVRQQEEKWRLREEDSCRSWSRRRGFARKRSRAGAPLTLHGVVHNACLQAVGCARSARLGGSTVFISIIRVKIGS